MASRKVFEDLDLSNDEIKRISEALKKEEFRKLLVEYAEEISDPENKKRYEAEIAQMEGERGMDIKFVHPDPGYVVKTTVNGNAKAFINICKNDAIGKPSSQWQTGSNGKRGMSWSLPHSFAPPRDDIDKTGTKCQVYDFVIHPDTYRMAETNMRFKNMVHDTALDGIEKQFSVKIDRKNLKYPKITYKGTPSPTVIRTHKSDAEQEETKAQKSADDITNKFPYPYDSLSTEDKMKHREEEIKTKEKAALKQDSKTKKTKPEKPEEDDYTEPKYSIKHRSEIDFQDYRNVPDAKTSTRPKELVVEIDLPLLKTASQVNLDIFEKQLILQSETPAKYKLELKLPYAVDENQGAAKFDKTKKRLSVTLPVIKEKTPSLTGDAGTVFEQNQDPDTIAEVNMNEVNMNGHTETMEMTPLVEVISSVPNEESEKELLNGDGSEPNVVDENVENMNKVGNVADQLKFTFPDYDFRQDDETVSFVLHAGRVDKSSVKLVFGSGSNGCHLTMTSVGSGGFPVNYSFCVQFDQDCTMEPSNSHADVSDQNVVLLLVKTDEAIGMWEKFHAGINELNLEEKFFLTKASLKSQLEKIEREALTCKEQGDMPELEVTDMNSDTLVVDIKENTGKRKKRLSESADDIEVIHEKGVPNNLHGILRQHSRTMSESSDDVLSSSYGRQNSSTSINGSESSLLESDENTGAHCGRRKTVSFSEYVDRTMYKSSQAPNSMRSTLKNKRKRQRKREQRQTGKQERRRTRSSGSEPSSDELCGTLHKDGLNRSESLDGSDEAIYGSQENSDNDDSQPEVDENENGEKAVVDSTKDTDKVEEDVFAKDDSEKATTQVKGTSDEKNVEKVFAKDENENSTKQVKGTSESAEFVEAVNVDAAGAACVPVSESENLENEASGACSASSPNLDTPVIYSEGGVKEFGSAVSDSTCDVKVDSSKDEYRTKEGEFKKFDPDENNQDTNTNSISPPQDISVIPDQSQKSRKPATLEEIVEAKSASGAACQKDPDAPETMLSWKAKGSGMDSGDHRTECAFNFSNNIMFDLDLD